MSDVPCGTRSPPCLYKSWLSRRDIDATTSQWLRALVRDRLAGTPVAPVARQQSIWRRRQNPSRPATHAPAEITGRRRVSGSRHREALPFAPSAMPGSGKRAGEDGHGWTAPIGRVPRDRTGASAKTDRLQGRPGRRMAPADVRENRNPQYGGSMRRSSLVCIVSSAVAFLGTLIASPPALAATFTVNSTDDVTDATPGDGQCATKAASCTLRAAIQEANAVPGPDSIRLPSGTFLIAREGADDDQCIEGDLDITCSITITGDTGTGSFIDANHRSRVFDVQPNGAAVISGVTIQNGSAEGGGGIRVNGGTLKLTDVTVSGNQAAAAGGGIWNDLGVLEVVRSTISGNVAHEEGGGIANGGTATLRNVTISGNTADMSGGGLRNLGSATLNNTTVAANTLTGVSNDGQLIFMNTLLANNAGPDCEGTLTSRGFNLIRTVSDCAFDGDTSGDLLNMDTALGPLQDNGGPTFNHALLAGAEASEDAHPTSIHALLAESAALEAANPTTPGTGDPACEDVDQRGVVRPQGPRCDIGAFEACADTGSPGGALVDACVGSCGDGVVGTGEECDSGSSNGAPGDPCDATCHLVTSQPGPEPTCGNGTVDAGEECDDGNIKNEDGCSSTCTLEEPISCKDDHDCDQDQCDAHSRFKDVNCVLESPVCRGEFLPGGVIKRIALARHRLAQASQTVSQGRGRKFVTKAVRVLNQAERIRKGSVRKGRLSPECAAALEQMLGDARRKCQSWRRSASF